MKKPIIEKIPLEDGVAALSQALNVLKNAEQVRAFLIDLCTPAELEALGTEGEEPIDLHPGAAEKYRRIAADLHNHLRVLESDPDRDALFADLQRLIEKVVVSPTGTRKPVTLEVHGLLASLLAASDGDSECGGMLVAGRGFEPLTFRL